MSVNFAGEPIMPSKIPKQPGFSLRNQVEKSEEESAEELGLPVIELLCQVFAGAKQHGFTVPVFH